MSSSTQPAAKLRRFSAGETAHENGAPPCSKDRLLSVCPDAGSETSKTLSCLAEVKDFCTATWTEQILLELGLREDLDCSKPVQEFCTHITDPADALECLRANAPSCLVDLSLLHVKPKRAALMSPGDSGTSDRVDTKHTPRCRSSFDKRADMTLPECEEKAIDAWNIVFIAGLFVALLVVLRKHFRKVRRPSTKNTTPSSDEELTELPLLVNSGAVASVLTSRPDEQANPENTLPSGPIINSTLSSPLSNV